MFPRWISVAAHKTQGNELTVASASSSNKKSTVGFFAFATKVEAHSFIEEPPNCAIIPIGWPRNLGGLIAGGLRG